MFLLRWSATDLFLMVTGAALVVGTVIWVIPRGIPRGRIEFTDAEIRSYDRKIPAYFIVSSIALLFGAIHMLVKSLPGVWMWLWEAGYAGHLVRDLANSHIVIVGGGTVLLTGITWYALPRMLRRPLFSEGLASVSLWLTVVGVFGFYFAWAILGIVEGSMVRDGMTYAAAKELVGGWHRIPTRVTATIMGFGYWTYVLNVVLTLWAGRRVASNPLRHLAKFMLVAALALFIGTVQGVVQVLPASADWIAQAGTYGEYIDPISHAHVNLVTGMIVFLVGVLGFTAPLMGRAISKRDVNRVFWVLVPGSILFYLAFLTVGLVGGGLVVGHGGIQNSGLASFLLPYSSRLIAIAGAAMLVGFWMFFVLVSRLFRAPRRTSGNVDGLAVFWAVSAGFLAVGTLQGMLQTIPWFQQWLVVAEEVPNVHAQLNMIGGVLIALMGTTFLLLPRVGGFRPDSVLVRRSLVGVSSGVGLLYVGTVASGVVRGNLIKTGLSGVEAASRMAYVVPLVLTLAAVPILWGFSGFFIAIRRSTVDYRRVRRAQIARAPTRIMGPMPARLTNGTAAGAVGMEAAGGLLGWPGIGWLRSGQAIVALPLLLIGPAVAWALIPMIVAATAGELTIEAAGLVIGVWLVTSTTISVLGLIIYRTSRSRRDKKNRQTEGAPNKPKIPKPIVVGTMVVFGALLSIPILAMARSGGGIPSEYPLLTEIPDRASGVYVAMSGEDGPLYLKLFSWAAPTAEVPPTTPSVTADSIEGFLVVQRGLDEFDRYRLFDDTTGSPVPLNGGPLADGRTMLLTPTSPLANDSYLFDVPTGGMFAGREYYYLNVSPVASTLVIAETHDPSTPLGVTASGVVAEDLETSWVVTMLVGLAGIVSTLFTIDLGARAIRSRKPHTLFYALGTAMFAIATWSLYVALAHGWSPAVFRTFYLFGAILTVPVLALGSAFLVLGRRTAYVAAVILTVLGAVAAFVTVASPFVSPLAETGIPAGSDVFAFWGPRIWAAVGSGLGFVAIVGLACLSVVRTWNTARPVAVANLMIVGGATAAAWGGTGLALGESAGFAVSLLLATSLIWLGHRTASVGRSQRKVPDHLTASVVSGGAMAAPST